ncbi:MAG: type II toxin-antitoxin system RelE/ParE family toxin [Methanomicrobia archaeon]|nr:type II toxin-antitoxin system RelE/ParE family toxin [Methanomicrobia archaeon]
MRVIYTEEFKRDVQKVKDKKIQDRIKKIVQKLKDNPEIGKQLRYDLSGFRSIRLHPFRMLYEIRDDLIILHKFEHRKRVYK